MFRPDIGMIKGLSFLAGESEDFFDSRCVRYITHHLRLRVRSDVLLDLHPDRLQIKPHLLQNVACDPLPELDQPEQEMLGTDVVVVKPISFLARKRQHLLRTWSKIIHHCNSARQDRLSYRLLSRRFSIRRSREGFQPLTDDISSQVVPLLSR